jgi:hypothetical protein
MEFSFGLFLYLAVIKLLLMELQVREQVLQVVD